MLVVNVSRTWPLVPSEKSAEESVLGDWAALNEAKIHQYGDAIIAVADGTVVAAYDIQGWERLENGRVRFEGRLSGRWAPLIGTPSPVTWTQGAARPVRYVESGELAGALANEAPGPAGDRITVGGWTLQVGPGGHAVVHMPAGCSLTVIQASPRQASEDPGR